MSSAWPPGWTATVASPRRERFAVELLVDPRAQETHQRAAFSECHVAQRTPRREHPASGRMAQVGQVGQVRPFVEFHRRSDLDHLQKRDGAFLHPGATGTGRGQ